MKVYKEGGSIHVELSKDDNVVYQYDPIAYNALVSKSYDNGYVCGYYTGIHDTINWDGNAYNEGYLNGLRDAGEDV